MKNTLRGAVVVAALSAMTALLPSQAATVAADGGITLWVSYGDSSVTTDPSVDDTVTMVNATANASCSPTNTGRAAVGAPNSPGSCPGGAVSCLGREKIVGDIEAFAEHLYQTSDGAHYVRRVYVADRGRSWNTADIKWDLAPQGSSAPSGAWATVGSSLGLRSTARRCIHDVLNHEFGHYFYRLPDRYARAESACYYRGRLGGSAQFCVGVTERDINTVMSNNFPHRFVDTTNARIRITYDPPGAADINAPGQILTPNLLTDGDASNDGPNRDHHNHTMPFAQDEWSIVPGQHVDLTGAHTEGDFSGPNMAAMPAVDIRFIGDEAPAPGTVLLLDRSGSMSVTTNGVAASQFVQEAGLYLYHSSEDTDFAGTFLYNGSVEELFEYAEYDPSNTLPQANFRPAQGLTNIAAALEAGIDVLVAEHGEGGANGGRVFLMSDGKQTTGPDLWTQVTRASGLGIQIHTLTFGNADVTTMTQIANMTSGGITEVSEKNDAAELKFGMTRALSEVRGYTSIYSFKDRVQPTGTGQNSQIFEQPFVVPPATRRLQFYSFLEGGNAALYRLQLIDPAGNVFEQPANSVARRGRFNGARVKAPEPGLWHYRIIGAKRADGVLPRNNRFEIVGYADNRQLDAQLILSGFDRASGMFRIEGSVLYPYPMTNAKARALIYAGGNPIGQIELFDDGENGGDSQPFDGVYSGLIDPRRLQADSQGRRVLKKRIELEFQVDRNSQPAPNAHYETGTDTKVLLEDYLARTESLNEPFKVWATLFNALRVDDENGRTVSLDLIEPRPPIKTGPAGKGELVLLLNGAEPTLEQLRATLGNGVLLDVLSIEPAGDRLGAIIKAVFVIDEKAQSGFRDLRLQVGGQVFGVPEALYID